MTSDIVAFSLKRGPIKKFTWRGLSPKSISHETACDVMASMQIEHTSTAMSYTVYMGYVDSIPCQLIMGISEGDSRLFATEPDLVLDLVSGPSIDRTRHLRLL